MEAGSSGEGDERIVDAEAVSGAIFVIRDVFLTDEASSDLSADFSLLFTERAQAAGDKANAEEEEEEEEKPELLDAEMAALGLPTSFSTSSAYKYRKNPLRRKKKQGFLIPSSSLICCDGAKDAHSQVQELMLQHSAQATVIGGSLPRERESSCVSTLLDEICLTQPADASRSDVCEPCPCDAADGLSVRACNGDQEMSLPLWVPVWDDYYARYYFYNSETLETTWDAPLNMEHYVNVQYDENGMVIHDDKEPCTYAGQLDDGHSIALPAQLVAVDDPAVDTEDLVGNSGQIEHDDNSGQIEQLHVIGISSDFKLIDDALSHGDEEVDELRDLSSLCTLGNSSMLAGNGGVDTNRANAHIQHIGDTSLSHCNDSVQAVNAEGFAASRVSRRKKKALSLTLKLESKQPNIVMNQGVSVFKYWIQRFHLFSKFNAGVKLDNEGWFSVTPEVIAKHQAERCKHGVVVDAFTGVGGNAIQFALAGHWVIAIDIDPVKIEFARHNATIYGVADRIDFLVGDFFVVAAALHADAVFLSPPWGGPEYLDVKVYDIQTMLQPKDGMLLFKVAQRIAPNIIFFLPRNVNLDQLEDLSRVSNPHLECEVERTFLNGKLKGVTAYYGKFLSGQSAF